MALGSIGPLSPTQLIHIPSTDATANLSLTSGLAAQVTVPSGARVASFSFNADIWVSYGATTAAAISPSSNTSAGSTACAEFNPTIRHIGSTAVTTGISVYSDFTCKGSVSFYA